MLIQPLKMDRFGFAIKLQAVTSSVRSHSKTKPSCSEKPLRPGNPQTQDNPCVMNIDVAKMCVVKNPMKANYARPFFVCSNKTNPCSFWVWGDVKPSVKPECRHGFSCVTRKVKKEGLDKGRLFFCCPNDKETSCRYFEWVPKVQSHLPYQSVSFTKSSSEMLPSKKSQEHYLTNDFINDLANNLNI